ncbi:sugar-specific transcriptional regulator TrmB [Methanomicrobium sp. W14]|uniref:TrmB family transcriptional regulator n=1 Tax=Methanomicrobium sp. W14 TaxID=2817839 RepID=UPI001AE6F9D9|nr:TrmB family transcriptional regulator [Methanomicrobium sp. W14]MBP2132115.1 sugar-specific transcriptional regulator TrmB [Methanomicrobium sp. W14]
MLEEQIDNLKKIGLNEYEARAYASLAGLREATAREILQAGNIPQGRIYDVLKQLGKKGFLEILDGNPTYYRAIEPTTVIQNLSGEYTQLLNQSMNTLRDLHIDSSSQYPLWVIHNEQAIINRIFALIRSARKEVIVFSGNPLFFRRFSSELQKIQKKCTVYVIVDDPEKFTGANLNLIKANEEFFYIMGDIIHDGIKYRNDFSVIIDRTESFDVVNIGSKKIGVVSKLPVISYIITRWLTHLNLIEDHI